MLNIFARKSKDKMKLDEIGQNCMERLMFLTYPIIENILLVSFRKSLVISIMESFKEGFFV